MLWQQKRTTQPFTIDRANWYIIDTVYCAEPGAVIGGGRNNCGKQTDDQGTSEVSFDHDSELLR